MVKFIYFLAFISLQILNSASREVDCDYTNNHYDVFGSIYQCKVVNDLTITLKEQSTIDSASQDHFSFKSNNDVIGFVADNKYLKFFPKGLEKVFGNLQLFHIRFTYIQELHQSDMKPFPKLKELDLHDNEIKVLEDGLFAYNPNLVFVSFSSNKIVHVGLTVFDGLNSLAYLYLSSNTCIDKGAYLSRSEVLDVIEYAKADCISSEYKEMDNKLNEIEDEAVFLNADEFEEKINDFEAQWKNSNFAASSTLKEKFEKLKQVKVSKADDLISLNPPSYHTVKRNEGNTYKIILMLVIVLSVVIVAGLVIMVIRRK